MGREREGNQTSQRRQHWWLEDGGGAIRQGTQAPLETRKGQEKKKLSLKSQGRK